MPPAPHVPGRELEGKPPSLTRRLRRKSDVPSLAWPMPPIRSPAARRIAEWFGLPLEARSSRPACGALAPGQAYFTHMAHDLPHAETCAALRSPVARLRRVSAPAT